ncbi:MAG: hypothetical protein CL814_09260 [Confluentimicrobium sp.]|uniref:COG4223 family protein n=1 Tax=Actibacterium sp. TaxID=1872125 RepID=UPI000C37B335|nr:hypothetical protein [Actibacterium sp.]MBC57113.1 hypothetical protein [Actibacterium sp.]
MSESDSLPDEEGTSSIEPEESPAETTETTPGISETDEAAIAGMAEEEGLPPVSEEPEPTEEPVAPMAPPPPPPARRGRVGFWGTLLGGVLAAVIGFGAAQFAGPLDLPFLNNRADTGMAETLAGQQERLTALSAEVSRLSDAVAAAESRDRGAELSDRIAGLETSLTDQIEALKTEFGGVRDELAGFETRLTTLEKRPVAETGDISGAVAAYERELDAMRSELVAQRAQNAELAAGITAAAESASAEIDAAAQRAHELEERGAMMRILASLETGGGFAPALDVLSGRDVPAALSAAAGGVPTIAALKEQFAEPARAALDASLRAEAGDNPGDRLSAFLRAQVGARSLTPREGNDPDAILSRAEAAVADGRLEDALAEIAALPEEGQAEMAGWVADAKTRIEAVAAAKALAATMNLN